MLFLTLRRDIDKYSSFSDNLSHMKYLKFLVFAIIPLVAAFVFSTPIATLLAKIGGTDKVAVALAPAREMRGVWMSTVLNIDYPQRPTVDPATLRSEFKSQLTRLRKIGINAIFVQVRPTGDAIYPSKLVPWSKWLTGRQGIAPGSDFDPLAYMIKEAHAQGMEFHAWINPYRVSMDLETYNLSSKHIYNQHPEWVKQYGQKLYLDPGIPMVQDHLMEVVEEILVNYPLNGIHFDDYFYPYPEPGQFFLDQESFDLYGTRFETKEDWRRDNVNTFVKRVSDLIERKKPWVKFGISPFGVWRNKNRDPNGSDTRAWATSYDDLYGDALGWAANGTVDYLVPQLYWNIGFEVADYAHLVEWWTSNVNYRTKLYVGHAAYKVGNNRELAWNDLEEIPRQIDLNRRNKRISGSMFFSAKSLLTSPIGLDARLKDIYVDRRLVPEQPDAPGARPLSPRLGKVKATERGQLLVWDVEKAVPQDDLPYYFAIYRKMEESEPFELIHVTPFGQNCRRLHFYDEESTGGTPIYEVRAVDRFHRESRTDELLP
ncbi:hypothetical protein CEQ90_06320 [Lewinellaceae bacterium SD302]|nr:hypothetical protein CEQ90_06320 [Lewinellaceae bacterium SD302]